MKSEKGVKERNKTKRVCMTERERCEQLIERKTPSTAEEEQSYALYAWLSPVSLKAGQTKSQGMASLFHRKNRLQ